MDRLASTQMKGYVTSWYGTQRVVRSQSQPSGVELYVLR
jgi:hypothetical protein